jgi:hypothetical protein
MLNMMLNMFSLTYLTVLTVLHQSIPTFTQDQDTVRLVQVLFRHGDRTPTAEFPTDVNNPYWDAVGLGELTETGMQQQYSLGDYLRSRYDTLLGSTYNATRLQVRSTDVDRTLMSAACNLAALYPPIGSQIWNSSLLWQPIPIHTVPDQNDTLLDSGSYCPRYDQLIDAALSSTDYQRINAYYEDLFMILANGSGLQITNIGNVWDLTDSIRIERLHDMYIPDWAEDNYDVMEEVCRIRLFYWFPDNQTRKLRGGPLLGEMVTNMQTKISGTDDDMRIYVFSAHDTTLAPFLWNLNIFNGLIPPLASCVLVELHELQDQFYVQILYRNDTEISPTVLSLPGCTDLCPFTTFTELTLDLIPQDIDLECQAQAEYNNVCNTLNAQSLECQAA